MENEYLECSRSCVAARRPEQRQHFKSEKDQAAKGDGSGNGTLSADSHGMATHSDPIDDYGACLHVPMTASELETHLVHAIAARTNGRVHALKVQVLGERTVVSGFSESFHAVQLAVAGVIETLDAMGLDQPGQVDVDIDVISTHSVRR
jgi:hypothetical protein